MNAETTFEQIDNLKRQLDEMLPLKQDAETKLWKKLALEWNYNSNHIEGNTLTYGETELLLYFDKTTGDHTKREYDEMQAHDLAIKMVRELATDGERPLTESFIRKLNETILVKPYWKEAITVDGQATRREIKVGEYKSFSNSVRQKNGEMFHYATPEETPAKMHDLMQWYNENQNLHPVELASKFHYKFVLIHPFDDGNGRVARLVMNYILMKGGLVPVIIKSADKEQYLTALNKADTGNLNAFVEYVAELLPWSLSLHIKAAKGEDLEEEDDVDKEIELLQRRIQSQGKVNKSPKLVYDIFQYSSGAVWNELDKALDSFNKSFNESKVSKHVNSWPERFETKTTNIFWALGTQEVSSKPKELKIFGFNVYDEDISVIKWTMVKYGLRGVDKVIDYKIEFKLNFYDAEYSVNLFLNGTAIFDATKKYNSLLGQQEVNDLIVLVKKTMLQSISQMLK